MRGFVATIGALLCAPLLAGFPAADAVAPPQATVYWSGTVTASLHVREQQLLYDNRTLHTNADVQITWVASTPAVNPRTGETPETGKSPVVLTVSDMQVTYAEDKNVPTNDGGAKTCRETTTVTMPTNDPAESKVEDIYLAQSGQVDPTRPELAGSYLAESKPSIVGHKTRTTTCPGELTDDFSTPENQPLLPFFDCDHSYGLTALNPIVLKPDGSRTVSGNFAVDCNPNPSTAPMENGEVRVTQHTQSVSYNLTGTSTPPPTPETAKLTVTNRRVGSGLGRVTGTSGVIDCGQGANTCTATVPKGTVVRLATLPSQYSKVTSVTGCDPSDPSACLVTMTANRQVTASFALDMDSLYEPEPDTLFNPDRKAEIAGNGAEAADKGSLGCAATAGIIAFGVPRAAGTVAVAGAGAAEAAPSLIAKTLEETVGACGEGLVGTITNGFLLKIDPPDPLWRKVSLPTRYETDPVPKCTLKRNCAAIRRAFASHARAQRRTTELREAMAVAANRYGNAVTAADLPSQRLHRATGKALSGMLVSAVAAEARAGKVLVATFNRGRITRITVTLKGSTRARNAVLNGRGFSTKALDRMIAKRLITSRAAGIADVKAVTRPLKPRSVNIFTALATPERTTTLAAEAATLRLVDLEQILLVLHADLAVPESARAIQFGYLRRAWACSSDSAPALTQLAAHAPTTASGLGAEGGAMVKYLAATLAKRGTAQGPGCPQG